MIIKNFKTKINSIEPICDIEIGNNIENPEGGDWFYSKSDITSRNLRGILKAQAFQEYLFHRYGFRIKVLEKLIEDKLQNVLSVDRKGRKEIADMISKGTMKIEAKSGLDIADKLLGGGSPR